MVVARTQARECLCVGGKARDVLPPPVWLDGARTARACAPPHWAALGGA